MKFTIKEDPKLAVAWLPGFFLVTWIVMLCLGGLGHRLNLPFLFKFDYWTVAILKIAVSGLVKTQQVTKWIGETV